MNGFRSRMPLQERIELDVSPEPNTGCWLWTRTLWSDGYARVRINKKQRFAHRVSFEAFKGAIPAGKVIDHLCRQRSCVNPAHLEAVTPAENTVRGAETRNSAAQAETIRDLRAEGLTQRQIAARLKVSVGHVSNVLSGKWPHVYRRPVERGGRT